MPAFTFEKISPPVPRGPIAPIEQKQRGVIVQMLDRLVEARARRAAGQDRAAAQGKVETAGRESNAPKSSTR